MNKYYIIAIAFVIFVVFLLINNLQKAECCGLYQKITFKEMEDNIKKDPDYILLDVRTQGEHNNSHIKGSLLIPVDEIEMALDIIPDKTKTIYVYCRSGNRSKAASNKLIEMGYSNVYDLGGIDNYKGELESTYEN